MYTLRVARPHAKFVYTCPGSGMLRVFGIYRHGQTSSSYARLPFPPVPRHHRTTALTSLCLTPLLLPHPSIPVIISRPLRPGVPLFCLPDAQH